MRETVHVYPMPDPKSITIINGPNLNLLGKREPGIYGSRGFESYLEELEKLYPDVVFHYFQSNVEGELVNALQRFGFESDGIILNPGGYTHTSVAIGDVPSETPSPPLHRPLLKSIFRMCMPVRTSGKFPMFPPKPVERSPAWG